jgi:hypothetical protein
MVLFRKLSRFFVRLVAVVLLLVLSLWLLLQTDPVQNWIISKVTSWLSKDLKTTVSIRHINFIPFNEAALQGVLLRDRHQDTLLYAGAIKVNITDWPFFKKAVELKYIDLEDARITASRTDSTWNYQFLVDYFSNPSPTPRTGKSGPSIGLKEIRLENVQVAQIDKWKGQDMILAVGSLHLLANDVNFNTKKVDIDELTTARLSFTLSNYPGNRPDSLRPKPVVETPESRKTYAQRKKEQQDEATPEIPEWNPDGWDLSAGTVRLRDCRFQNIGYTARAIFSYFDPLHIDFNHIDAHFDHVRMINDTLTTTIALLRTKERSGIEVKKLSAKFRFTPRIMEFRQMDLITNRSHLRDYFAMRYDGFSDGMGDFVTKVNMRGELKNSLVSTDDIAYFAPELKTWNKLVDVNGHVEGPVAALKGQDLLLKSGQTVYISGDFAMTGLPDIDKTVMNFQLADLRTSFDDVGVIVPSLRSLADVNMAALQTIRFKGSYTGMIRDFTVIGTMQTALGTVTSNLNMKLPDRGTASYKGLVTTAGLDLGKFLSIPSIGAFSLSATVDGKGFAFDDLDATLKGQISSAVVNNYTYQNINVQGSFKKKLFDGQLSIDDPNAAFNLEGKVQLDKAAPVFNFQADVSRLNFQSLGLIERDLGFQGKLALNFKGRNIDDFTGTAKVFDATLSNNGEPISFDSLTLASDTAAGDNKVLTLQSLPVTAKVEGQYHILELPRIVQWYLGKYYPSYIKPIPEPPLKEDFTFSIHTDDVEDYIDLFKLPVTGLDNSDVSGRVSSVDHIFNVDISVPEFSYKRFDFNDIAIKTQGNDQKIKLEGALGEIVLSDSLRLPSTRVSIAAQNDNSVIALQTSATQNLSAATLIMKVHNTSDGVSAHFDSSSFVLNDKKWLIASDGEIDVKKDWISISNLRMSSSLEQIDLSSHPSGDNPASNDIDADLTKVTIEDILPLFVKEPHMEGQMSGKVTIRDPFGKMGVEAKTHLDQFRFETDSIGTVNAGATYTGDGNVHFDVTSENPHFNFNMGGGLILGDSSNRQINARITLENTSLHLLEHYLGFIFSDMQGGATGTIQVSGPLSSPQLVGKVNVQKGMLRVNYTQCKYLFDDEDIDFRPGVIDFDKITLKDTLGNTALFSGSLQHDFFKNMSFNLRVSSDKVLVLNTSARDNKNFYGKAIARVNATLTGPESNIVLRINQAEPVDSSHIYIPSTSNKAGALPDFIVFKEYGKEMTADESAGQKSASNFTVQMNLLVNNYAKIYVILDPVNGDIVKAQGNGNLVIQVGTSTPLTINGTYNIESGEYTYSYANFGIRKPFTLSEGNIRWTGDPYSAYININANYTATDVALPNIASSTGSYITETTNIIILCHLTSTLNHPDINFEFQLPSDNPYKNDPIVTAELKQYQDDKSEMNKQVTSLLLFDTFISSQDALASNVNGGQVVAGTVGQVVAGQLSATLRALIKKILKDNTIDPYITINPGFAFQNNQSLYAVTNASKLGVNKSFISGRLVFKLGTSLDYATSAVFAQKGTDLLWSPDFAVQWSISQDGHLRLGGYNHTIYDVLYGHYNRSGISLSYRKDFDHLIDLFAGERKQVDARRPKGPAAAAPPPPPPARTTGSTD